MSEKLKLVDLFAGSGGFSLAFENTGKFETVFANDIEQSSKKIFDLNFETELTLMDIHKLDIDDIPKMDILTAGFPCQPFSIAGQRKGFEDTRSNVFWKLLEIIKHHLPRVIVLENVKNLTTHDKGNSFKIIIESLEKTGYHLKHKVLNTCKITNIPQNRERIYIIGFLEEDECDNFEFPKNESCNLDIAELLDKKVDKKYYYDERFKCWDVIEENITEDVYSNVIYQYRRTIVRKNKSGVCPTLTANMGGGGHNVPLLKDKKGIRKLTPRECFRLQGFPDTYKLPKLSDSFLYKLAGNAISTNLVEKIANNIVIALDL